MDFCLRGVAHLFRLLSCYGRFVRVHVLGGKLLQYICLTALASQILAGSSQWIKPIQGYRKSLKWVTSALQIMWLLYALVWGTVRLFESWQPERLQLSYWSFGQWFPVLLLVLPFLSSMEFYVGRRHCPNLQSF
jgi:hypothetical protein